MDLAYKVRLEVKLEQEIRQLEQSSDRGTIREMEKEMQRGRKEDPKLSVCCFCGKFKICVKWSGFVYSENNITDVLYP